MNCRHCGAAVTLPFVDLGSAPPSNAYLSAEALRRAETWYPLRVLTCTRCWLVQTDDFADRAELFSPDYAYFSSYSSTWLQHAEQYVAVAAERFALGAGSLVIEIAANDGYLLQYVRARGIPCLGIEPTASTASVARGRGLDVLEEFFGAALGRQLAAGGRAADLIVANNVLAHVPDINDFAAGVAALLKPAGVATFEFPHLLRLVDDSQFDTIYHEHFSYLSLTATARIFEHAGLSIFDVEELPTHGGSLRVFAQRTGSGGNEPGERVARILEAEVRGGLTAPERYAAFQAQADRVKHDLLSFLIDSHRAGRTVAAYGAAAKGNTLMNYAGVRPDLIRFVVDRNPAKQGKYMPGSRVPIVDEARLRAEKPDVLLILPWNLKAEIAAQLHYVRDWGATFVTAVSRLETVA